ADLNYLYSLPTRRSSDLPPTNVFFSTFLWTNDAAEIIALSPISTPGKIVVFAPIKTLLPILTSPIRYSLIKYSCANIVVLYPIIVLSPIDIFSGNIVSGITIKANAVSLPTFIFKNVRYNQFLTLKKGIKRPIEIIIKFFITLKNETVLYICHKEFVPSTG